VLLRFFFGANDATTYDGFAFDNFEIRAGCAWLETAAGNDWHTAANWDCGHVPSADDIAMLPWLEDAITTTISADAVAAAVGVEDNLILAGGDLTTRYVYEYGVVYIAEGHEVNLTGSGNAWEATWETQEYWDEQWGAPTNGLVRFSGPGVQRIVHDYEDFAPSQYAQFYDVVVGNGSHLDVKSHWLVARNLTVESGGTVAMGVSAPVPNETTGALQVVEFALAVNGALTNNGTLRQQKTLGAAYYDVAFFNTGGYGGLKLNPSGFNLGPTTVQIRGGQECTTIPGETLQRCFNIAPTTAPGSPGVAVTFYFTVADLPVGHTCETVELYHHDSITWSLPITRDVTYGTNGRDCANLPYSIRVTGVTDFSPFVLAGSGAAPTAVRLRDARALSGLPGFLGLVGIGWSLCTLRRCRRHLDPPSTA